MYTVIMAGGKGKRFWPESRRRLPKQLLNITGDETMIQATVRRFSPLVPVQNILVVTNQLHAHRIREQLPEILDENIIVEPIGRNTAACIGLAALYIKRLNPEAIMIASPADHVIRDEESFIRVLRAAGKIAEENRPTCAASGTADRLVTLGIVPSRPETGFGYIHLGEEIGESGKEKAYLAAEFVEKPGLKTAQEFLRDGGYLWNSGIFVWKTSTILRMIQRYLPKLYSGLSQIEQTLGTKDEIQVIRKVYQGLEPISIDYGVMEKACLCRVRHGRQADEVVVLKGDFGWSDVGSWAALDEVSDRDENGNLTPESHIGIDTKNSIIRSSKKLVATIGLENLVIVETDDALLVCRKDRSQDVKKIVEILEKERMEQYL